MNTLAYAIQTTPVNELSQAIQTTATNVLTWAIQTSNVHYRYVSQNKIQVQCNFA